jgi:site-specific DNA-methyltransferase (adenine-specific)
MLNQIILGDCYELMKEIPDGSIEAIISDFPYNTTAAETDQNPFDAKRFWPEAKRILSLKGIVITTSCQPFTTDLINSNRAWFKYCLIWDKNRGVGHLNAHKRPMAQHEDIVIFSPGGNTFNPQMKRGKLREKGSGTARSEVYGGQIPVKSFNNTYFPTSILTFDNNNQANKIHPTQKPIALYQYLILTYTNPGDTILEPFCGSGTTALAAFNTGRNFIAFEELAKYWQIANKRLSIAQSQLRFDEMVS